MYGIVLLVILFVAGFSAVGLFFLLSETYFPWTLKSVRVLALKRLMPIMVEYCHKNEIDLENMATEFYKRASYAKRVNRELLEFKETKSDSGLISQLIEKNDPRALERKIAELESDIAKMTKQQG